MRQSAGTPARQKWAKLASGARAEEGTSPWRGVCDKCIKKCLETKKDAIKIHARHAREKGGKASQPMHVSLAFHHARGMTSVVGEALIVG